MTVRVEGAVTLLEGQCGVEEAEDLLRALLEDSGRSVDLSGATRIHLALVQVLAIARAPVVAPPDEPFLRGFLLPALQHLCQGQSNSGGVGQGK